MAIPVATVLRQVDDLLLDEQKIRWPDDERIRWINEALGAILIRRPQAFFKAEIVPLVDGARQTCPGSQLLDVVCNIGYDGITPGISIRRTDRQLLDDTDIYWMSSAKSGVIEHYTFDERMPTTFYCYPPAQAGALVELHYSGLPTLIDEADINGTIDIGAEYLEAITNYVCYRCDLKDTEYAASQIGSIYYQAFERALGIQSETQAASSPNLPNTSV